VKKSKQLTQSRKIREVRQRGSPLFPLQPLGILRLCVKPACPPWINSHVPGERAVHPLRTRRVQPKMSGILSTKGEGYRALSTQFRILMFGPGTLEAPSVSLQPSSCPRGVLVVVNIRLRVIVAGIAVVGLRRPPDQAVAGVFRRER
jgi:hypothetical protein